MQNKKLSKTFWMLSFFAMATLLSVMVVTMTTGVAADGPVAMRTSSEMVAMAADCTNPCQEQGITHGCTNNGGGTCINGEFTICDGGMKCVMEDGDPVCKVTQS
jgi:hypothetical protein